MISGKSPALVSSATELEARKLSFTITGELHLTVSNVCLFWEVGVQRYLITPGRKLQFSAVSGKIALLARGAACQRKASGASF